MRVLLLGGNGYLGPHVVAELERDHELVLTDITPIQTPHAAMVVDLEVPASGALLPLSSEERIRPGDTVLVRDSDDAEWSAGRGG